ncbi:hypothetical protein K438DRAFT_1926119 [Mycena galopus ATCC 62051]|nr:hypothetical protein K438DRAFT_1926119 [Mycena galopus ATCC 62051]
MAKLTYVCRDRSVARHTCHKKTTFAPTQKQCPISPRSTLEAKPWSEPACHASRAAATLVPSTYVACGVLYPWLISSTPLHAFDGAFEDRACGKFHFEVDAIKFDPLICPHFVTDSLREYLTWATLRFHEVGFMACAGGFDSAPSGFDARHQDLMVHVDGAERSPQPTLAPAVGLMAILVITPPHQNAPTFTSTFKYFKMTFPALPSSFIIFLELIKCRHNTFATHHLPTRSQYERRVVPLTRLAVANFLSNWDSHQPRHINLQRQINIIRSHLRDLYDAFLLKASNCMYNEMLGLQFIECAGDMQDMGRRYREDNGAACDGTIKVDVLDIRIKHLRWLGFERTRGAKALAGGDGAQAGNLVLNEVKVPSRPLGLENLEREATSGTIVGPWEGVTGEMGGRWWR